ncbi:HNH endonuclease [Streptomyces sp. NPDC059459]|uniref:HNH endonuclease n=1 Tax=Streptomyces sp. NPDC059459 TaxID=3346839 RepID=UPI0036CA48F7
MSQPAVRVSRPQSWRNDFIRACGYRCHYCNRFAGSTEVGPDGKPWHVEHMNALANGGADSEENLTLACGRCNSLKATRSYENFRRYARAILWAREPQRLNLRDMEGLETAFLKSTGGSWMHRDITEQRDEHTSQIVAVVEGDPNLDSSEVVAEVFTTGGHTGGRHNLDFIVQVHRLMPQLIAEIHLLHAELRLLRGETQATEDAA